MSPDEIAKWAAADESATLEFKKYTAEKDRACRTLCAFANGQRGRLVFGVTPPASWSVRKSWPASSRTSSRRWS